MKRFQFDEIAHQFRATYQSGKWHQHYPDKPIIIRVLAGRQDIKGRDFEVTGTTGSEFYVRPVGENTDPNHYGRTRIKYVNCEIVNEDGEVEIAPITDMTGRTITEGAFVCYSVAEGRNSHALEIGRVIRLGQTGTLTVARTLRNGNKITSRYGTLERLVNDPDRSLRLPVEPETLTMWLLRDFEDIGEDDDFSITLQESDHAA